MGDFLLNEALKRLATEAAIRFSALIAGGDQIPFDVAREEGPDSPFYRYLPLTARYVLARENELRSLPAFGGARDAVEEAGLAAAYLEDRGESVPADAGERAARMLILFIASLWDGCTEFSLDPERFANALALLGAEARDAHLADVLIVPLVGLRMSEARLGLPHGVRILRADTIEAPIEAMRSEGMGRAAWEPQFLALAEQSGEAAGLAAALRQLRELISVMRLFKAGGIGLGPHAFAPTGEGRWRRVATGSPAARPGGYELTSAEAGELAELASALEARPDPGAALAWAIGRFELGCARESALEGLSDQLLALRAVLEGQGPVGATLAMRAAALIADRSIDRIEARERVEGALELERSLMNGDHPQAGRELARWTEEGVRRVLREAALGELGTDISIAADETLIATGLEAGDAEIAVAVAEINPPPGGEADGLPQGRSPGRLNPPSADEDASFSEPDPEQVERLPRQAPLPEHEHPPPPEEELMEPETRIMEPIPAPEEIRISATPWLEEVSLEHSTLDFPAIEGISGRERIDSPRIRHLFSVPDADWEIGELHYSHYGRRAG